MELPKTLIKFYSNTEYFEEFLQEKKLAVVHAEKLNDPFDPPLFIHGDESWQKAISNWQESEESMRAKVLRNLYISSFCAKTEEHDPRKSLYMWGHYADGHRGVAVEFDYKILRQNLNEITKKMHIRMPLQAINYEEPKILNSTDLDNYLDGDKSILENNLEENLFRKTSNWKEENEYRFMLIDKSNKLRDVYKIKIWPKTIKAIYFGMRNKDIDDLTALAKINFPKSDLFEAKKITGKLDLEFEEIK